MFAAMAAFLVVALAVPGAFNENALEFALAYTGVRVMHIVLYALATNDIGARQAILMLAPPSGIACALLIGASSLDGVPQGALWALALAIDYGGALLFGGNAGYRVHVEHFVERHGLIVIIALGESIVALGIGASSQAELVPAEILAAVLGTVVAASLWWTYFDVTTIVAERRLSSLTGVERTKLARDSFSFLHLPLVAGIVLFALGTKKTLEYWDKPLDTVPAVALCGGVALFFLAHVARRARAMHTFGRHRFIAALVALALIPLATEVDALYALTAVAALTSALVAYEAMRFRDARRELRASAH
jgi:low temperature requirement protein LtrA